MVCLDLWIIYLNGDQSAAADYLLVGRLYQAAENTVGGNTLLSVESAAMSMYQE